MDLIIHEECAHTWIPFPQYGKISFPDLTLGDVITLDDKGTPTSHRLKKKESGVDVIVECDENETKIIHFRLSNVHWTPFYTVSGDKVVLFAHLTCRDLDFVPKKVILESGKVQWDITENFNKDCNSYSVKLAEYPVEIKGLISNQGHPSVRYYARIISNEDLPDGKGNYIYQDRIYDCIVKDNEIDILYFLETSYQVETKFDPNGETTLTISYNRDLPYFPTYCDILSFVPDRDDDDDNQGQKIQYQGEDVPTTDGIVLLPHEKIITFSIGGKN